MERISIDELVKRIKSLKPGEELHFLEDNGDGEDCGTFGAGIIEKFETFFLLLNFEGGGCPFMAEVGEDHFPMEAEQGLFIYLSELELVSNFVHIV